MEVVEEVVFDSLPTEIRGKQYSLLESTNVHLLAL